MPPEQEDEHRAMRDFQPPDWIQHLNNIRGELSREKKSYLSKASSFGERGDLGRNVRWFFVSIEDLTESSFEKSMRIIQGDGQIVQFRLHPRGVDTGDGRVNRGVDRMFRFMS